MINIENYKNSFEKNIEHLKKELATIRTGRANPALVENILVEAYNTKTPLKQLSSITVAEAKSLVIQPWDKTIVKEIEKQLAKTNLEATIRNEGSLLRMIMPPLTEENRKNLVKVLNQKLEAARVAIRVARDEIRGGILTEEKNKEITEDDKFRLLEKLDTTTKNYIDKVEELGEKKKEEILTI